MDQAIEKILAHPIATIIIISSVGEAIARIIFALKGEVA